jgi:ferredoxin
VPDYAQRLTLLCGPEGLMAPVRKRWVAEGLEKNLLWERFSMVAPPVEGATSVKVSCLKSGRNFEASTGQPMLLTAEAAGLTPRYGCRSGICHTCRYRKRSGRVTNILLDTVSEEPNEMIQLCVSVPCSDVELEDL